MPDKPDAPLLSKQDFQKLSRFRYQLRCFLRQSEDICRQHGLTSLQYQLLLHLRGFEGREWATVGELAERLQSKHHAAVMLVDRCAQLELIERRTGRDDGRRIEIHLLPRGAQLAEKIATQHQPELQHLDQALDLPGLS
ncbi:MarR family transcriptional regulator [Halomonas dongshanensis]|uniref:MarR family transcriptional regulator n=1 Tax=Halomonas dongshanensis TaxID=2890835 RepID=A0ABT2EFV2_9GAMM|nr:helix-turn-helix domain-containing protein [Halomonas dongshanensis]MCS2610468.1 MarR family transcriptional regulator [Halomonas dongshanensis]